MNHTYKVTDSSTIESLEYDFDSKKLIVEFKAGSKYLYRDVPEKEAREFFLAESKGKHFAAYIKDAYDTEKIGATLNPPASWRIKPPRLAAKAAPAKPAKPAKPAVKASPAKPAAKAKPAPKAKPTSVMASWPFPTGCKP